MTVEHPSRPSISAIIPVRNRADTIGRAVASILGQTAPPDEVLVVDDGSTDATADRAASVSDPRLRVIRLSQNAGAQAARNTGIRAAIGDWIAFLDSDDQWLPAKLEKQIAALSAAAFDPATVVYTNGIWIDARGRKRTNVIHIVEGDALPAVLRHGGPLFQSMLVSKEALERIGYLDESVPAYQEWDTSIRLARFCRFVYIPEPLFIYNRHGGETISKDRRRAAEGFRFVTEKFEGDIREHAGEQAWQEHLLHRTRLSLDAKLWRQADADLARISGHPWAVAFLRVCRLFHIAPTPLLRMRERVLPWRAA